MLVFYLFLFFISYYIAIIAVTTIIIVNILPFITFFWPSLSVPLLLVPVAPCIKPVTVVDPPEPNKSKLPESL
jgi:hypothetical protein